MKRIIKSLMKRGLDYFIFEKFSAKISQLNTSQSLYEQIFETKPLIAPKQYSFELHFLVCEKDFLRSFWALKSFFYYSNLSARLVIQDDGTLTEEMIELYKKHFPKCIVNTNNDDELQEALTGYPMCQFFLGHHAISKKLFPPLLLSKTDYVMIMDSDILWFKQSNTITNCVKKGLPFYVDGGSDGAYVRNQKFMQNKLGIYPADRVNTGIVGYQKSKFLDLEFIESAIQKLVYIPKEFMLESLGYNNGIDIHSEDINKTLCWWVMEQTIYALLLGREPQRQVLKHWSNQKLDQLFGDLHQFTNSPIMKGTTLIHYISDRKHNQFFPTGVQHLIKRGFLEKLSKLSYTTKTLEYS